MDKLLSALLASNSPESVKKQVYLKIKAASADPHPSDEVIQIFLISSNMALDNSERTQTGVEIFTTWAGNNPTVLKDFMTSSFVLRLLDARAEYSATSVELLHSCLRILDESNIDIEPYAHIVRTSTVNFIRETKNVETLDALLKFLLDYKSCVPTYEFRPAMCLALILSISQLPLPKEQSSLVHFIKSVERFASFTRELWREQKQTMNRALSLILEIMSKKDCDQEPSVALAAVIQLVPVDIIPEAVTSVLDDKTLDDGNLSAALHRLINWLGWITATNIPAWILAFLRGLAGAKKYGILIQALLTKVQMVFDCLRFTQLRTHALPVLKLMLLSFQHSPQAFHKIASSLPATIQLLRDEDSVESREVLLELNDLARTLMNHFSGFPDLYEPIIEALKDFEEPSAERMKSLLSENKWTALTTQAAMNVVVPKSETGKVGLDNLGNSCYVNSIIQALYMCDELRHMVFSSPAYSLQSLPGKLQQLFAFLKLSERGSYCPRDFVTASRPSWFLPGQQNDCSEYLKYLLDQLNEAEKQNRRITDKPMDADPSDAGPSSSEIEDSLTSIENLFLGKIETTITCLECGFQSARNEDFFDLPLAFPESNLRGDEVPTLVGGDSNSACANVSQVQELAHGDSVPLEKLVHYYLQPEVLKEDNQYLCTQCDKLRDAERTLCITRAPRYILFTLLRFSYDAKTQSRTKLLTDVNYPLSLMLSTNQKARKRKHDEKPSENFSYQLNSVIVHSGMSSDCGHYYTYARHLNQSLHSWYQFNDDRVSYASYESFSSLNRRFRLDTPYVLVYRRTGDPLDDDPDMDPILVSAVSRDNAQYRQELEKSTKSVRFNLGPKGPGDRDEPPGGCGLGGFPGLNGGARFVF